MRVQKFVKTADLIKTLPSVQDKDELFKQVTRLIFPNDSVENQIDVVIGSFEQYNLVDVKEEFSYVDKITATVGRNSPAFTILMGYAEGQEISFIHEEIPGYSNYWDLKLNLLKRIFGAVLHGERDSLWTIPIRRIKNGKYIEENISPVYPSKVQLFPQLIERYDDKLNIDNNMVKRKYEMIFWMLNVRGLTFQTVRKINKKFLCSILVLVYLVEVRLYTR